MFSEIFFIWSTIGASQILGPLGFVWALRVQLTLKPLETRWTFKNVLEHVWVGLELLIEVGSENGIVRLWSHDLMYAVWLCMNGLRTTKLGVSLVEVFRNVWMECMCSVYVLMVVQLFVKWLLFDRTIKNDLIVGSCPNCYSMMLGDSIGVIDFEI